MAESAIVCSKRAVPCRRRTHPPALSKAPNEWRAKRATAIFPYEPPSARPGVTTHRRTLLRHSRLGRLARSASICAAEVSAANGGAAKVLSGADFLRAVS
ncbi:Hypothetical predicted protein [Lynx pardinus]|uniref:Uncharacterized protein n=1 Tax=Lynx pardinus TaxID=191816 RepID=A0A485N5H8_LYNPA|nr:Hypothetical predicted protein [Lynx pardinus]